MSIKPNAQIWYHYEGNMSKFVLFSIVPADAHAHTHTSELIPIM